MQMDNKDLFFMNLFSDELKHWGVISAQVFLKPLQSASLGNPLDKWREWERFMKKKVVTFTSAQHKGRRPEKLQAEQRCERSSKALRVT